MCIIIMERNFFLVQINFLTSWRKPSGTSWRFGKTRTNGRSPHSPQARDVSKGKSGILSIDEIEIFDYQNWILI